MTGEGEEVERVPNWGGNVVTGSGKANGMMPVLRVRLKRTTIQTDLNVFVQNPKNIFNNTAQDFGRSSFCWKMGSGFESV